MAPAAAVGFRIVELPPMCVATARGFGPSPEAEAWATLLEWAERNNLDPAGGGHRFFGFNDPGPSGPDEPYGYQQWMTVEPGTVADPHEEVSMHEFQGGRYATTRCEGLEHITDAWRALFDFVAASELEHGPEPGLEELLTLTAEEPTDYVFDLFLPIAPA